MILYAGCYGQRGVTFLGRRFFGRPCFNHGHDDFLCGFFQRHDASNVGPTLLFIRRLYRAIQQVGQYHNFVIRIMAFDFERTGFGCRDRFE